MMDKFTTVRGACECGTCTFAATAAPEARLICHCTICQAFTGRGHSDVVVYPARKVRLNNPNRIVFRKYKRLRFPPPNLNRGRCENCGRPVVEIGGVWPLKILFLPAANFDRSDLLPRPAGHLFYEHRQRDIDDGVPKYEGYFDSQRTIAAAIIRAT